LTPAPPQHVVFATAGTAGDLHPVLGRALAVAARGVRTTVMVNAIHAPQVERAGLRLALRLQRHWDLARRQKVLRPSFL
jgi:hypothetical protein